MRGMTDPIPSDPAAVDAAPLADRLRRILRHLPAPVGIVSSIDPDDGSPVGLAMSAIMPVSLDPPAMAIGINRAGASHDAMIRSGRFCINLLDDRLHGHILPFSDPAARDTRFTQPEWTCERGLWIIAGAPANIFCTIADRVSYGTHDVLVGAVDDVIDAGGVDMLGWGNGAPGRLSPLG